MSGTIYDEIKVNVALGDIAKVHSAANCFTISDEQLSKARNDLSRLREECEAQAKEIGQLRARLIETEQDLKKWTEAAQTEKPIADANAFLDEHNTPFEGKDVDTACEVIRALLAAKPEAEKPRKLSPLFKQRVANAADVLRCMKAVVMSSDGELPAIEGDRYNTVLKTLADLHDVIMAELPEVMK